MKIKSLAPLLALGAFTTCMLAASCGPSDPQGPVCDPLGSSGQPPTSASGGLVASLYSIPDTTYPTTGVVDAEAAGIKSSLQIFLNMIDVPNQHYDRGFVASNGLPLTNPDGSVITAWFALHIEGRVQLGPNDPAGPYQFATYSDDGSIMQIDTGSGFQMLVNNDFSHQSKLEVSTTPVNMTAGTPIPIKLDYMQTAPDFLSFIVLWRPWPTDTTADPVQDPSAGEIAPNKYWDSSVYPSVPQQAWLDLLSRGWKVMTADNFLLPAGSAPNPCAGASGSSGGK